MPHVRRIGLALALALLVASCTGPPATSSAQWGTALWDQATWAP